MRWYRSHWQYLSVVINNIFPLNLISFSSFSSPFSFIVSLSLSLSLVLHFNKIHTVNRSNRVMYKPRAPAMALRCKRTYVRLIVMRKRKRRLYFRKTSKRTWVYLRSPMGSFEENQTGRGPHRPYFNDWQQEVADTAEMNDCRIDRSPSLLLFSSLSRYVRMYFSSR